MIIIGRPQMFWAAMPEASIHKNRGFALAKNEIRSPKNRLIAPPASYVIFSEYFNQGEFSGFVSPASDSRHHFRTLFFGKNISHFLYPFSSIYPISFVPQHLNL
jgi:hypothetical protein